MGCSRFFQFIRAAVTVCHADARDTERVCGTNIVGAVADHNRRGCRYRMCPYQSRENLFFVAAVLGIIAPRNSLEICRERKSRKDTPRLQFRF
mgnify:CR=1 FL=1